MPAPQLSILPSHSHPTTLRSAPTGQGLTGEDEASENDAHEEGPDDPNALPKQRKRKKPHQEHQAVPSPTTQVTHLSDHTLAVADPVVATVVLLGRAQVPAGAGARTRRPETTTALPRRVGHFAANSAALF